MKLRLLTLLVIFSITACHNYNSNDGYKVYSLQEEAISTEKFYGTFQKEGWHDEYRAV